MRLFPLYFLIVAVVGWLALKSNEQTNVVLESFAPNSVPTSELVENLHSEDPDVVRESLHFLTERAVPDGVPRAQELLESEDAYIWFNAALYLGACGHQEAVPYLIKGLRHTAWRTDEETLSYLHQITGQDIPNDFAAWQKWYLKDHPNTDLDWISHLGHDPRLEASAEVEDRTF